jgi:hypothetical protein
MSIGQKVLVTLRGVTFAYLVMSFFMIVDYEIDRNDHGWLTVFEFSNVAYFLQLLYQGIAFVSPPCILFICLIALSYLLSF